VTAWVGLLRGINVGGNRMIAMADLRKMVAAAGGKNVATYIQSGNVVFDHASRAAPKLAGELEKKIAKATGFAVPVVLRTAEEWASVIARNPFAGADDDHLHVSFLAAPPSGFTLEAKTFEPEKFAQVERDVYMMLPLGVGRSKLAGALAKQKSMAAATTRNWRTVLKLAEMVSQPGKERSAGR
jgi:uncharacterized protein (DUF1697 family)